MESESRIARPEPGICRVLAPNPSPMTCHGTNTYIVGQSQVCVIDPGPEDEAHRQTLMRLLETAQTVTAILVTHSHLDHSPLARALSDATGAPVLAAGPSDWGRGATMAALARSGAIGGGEGVDAGFQPDRQIGEGDRIATDLGPLEVLATPGHMANHLSFAIDGALFSGDIVMGWATSLISPPDGDLTAFMASVTRLETRGDRVFYPGHGDPVPEPATRCRALLTHRRKREAQIVDALRALGSATAAQLADVIYTDVAPTLLPAATRNVLAHLLDLSTRSIARPDAEPGPQTRFALV